MNVEAGDLAIVLDCHPLWQPIFVGTVVLVDSFYGVKTSDYDPTPGPWWRTITLHALCAPRGDGRSGIITVTKGTRCIFRDNWLRKIARLTKVDEDSLKEFLELRNDHERLQAISTL